MSIAGSPLESIYRRALTAYPRSWRARYGEELIGVMQDIAENQHRTRPRMTDMTNLVFHGITTRIVQAVSKVAPTRRRNRIAAAATIISTALAVTMMVLGELGRWFRWNSYTQADGLFGPFTTVASITYLLVIASFIALAMGWDGMRRLLLALVIVVACFAMPFLPQSGQGAVAVGWYVPAFFATASVLALSGSSTRTLILKRTVLAGTPIASVLLTAASYLQGGGSQRTFYGTDHIIFDQMSLTRAVAEILTLSTIILLANRKLLPWAILIGGIALHHPLSILLLFVGGDVGIGLAGIQPDKILAICCIVAPLAAWIAWKRPRLQFTSPAIKTLGS